LGLKVVVYPFGFASQRMDYVFGKRKYKYIAIRLPLLRLVLHFFTF
jgi:hypothetical protein